jgi:beta-glucanase (GH16 family)
VLPDGVNWRLVWNDEFDGTKIDPSKWNIQPDAPRGAGFWSPNNVSLDGEGHIVFKATVRDGKPVGAGIDTFRKFAAVGGFFTFRCKLSAQPGYRPAIWITTSLVERVGDEGRDGTEIDVMEQPSRNNVVHLSLHWDGYGKDHKTTTTLGTLKGGLDDWHIFSVWWRPDRYIFYVDGQEAWNTSDGGVSKVPEIIKIGIEPPWPLERFQRRSLDEKDTFICDYARYYRPVE